MKKTLMFMIITICCCLFCFDFFPNNNTPTNQEYSQEFTEYLNADDKSKYGNVIPLMHEAEVADEEEIEPYVDLGEYYCLRDDYIIYTQDQDSFGLCWAYSSMLSLETYFAINYHEYYNFSSAWVGLTTKLYWDNNTYPGEYMLGSGGNIHYFELAVENYGLMLQSEFDLTDLYSCDNDNYINVYNEHKSKVLDNLFDLDLNYKRYTNVNDIKNHIVNNGSLYAGVYSEAIVNETSLCSTDASTGSNHAVSIIGWDDNFTATGWTSPGAWIALNSWNNDWGNDGVFYISYNDAIASKSIYGLEITSSSQLTLTNSSNDVDNMLVNKYNSLYAKSGTTKVEKQFNIFDEGENINLEYTYDTSIEPKNIEVTAKVGNRLINNQINSIEFGNGKLNIKTNSLSSGTYRLDITFVLQDDTTLTFNKAFTVTGDVEIGTFFLMSDATNQTEITNQVGSYYSNFNTFNKSQNAFDIYTNRLTYAIVYMPTYSKITSYNCTVDDGVLINKITSNFTKYSQTNSQYANGYLYFIFITNDLSNAPYEINITLYSGTKTRTLTINVYAYNPSTKIGYLNAEYNGASTETLPKTILCEQNQNRYRPQVSKGNSIFEGWYTSPTFEESTKLPSDTRGYYINQSHFKQSTDYNYVLDNYSNDNMYFNYINLYAKWSNLYYNVNFEIATDVKGTIQTYEKSYLASHTLTINLSEIISIPESVEGYDFVWASGNTNVKFSDGFAIITSINQDIKITGTFVPNAPEISNLHTTKIVSITSSEQTSTKENKNTLVAVYDPRTKYVLSITSTQIQNVKLEYTWKKLKNDNYVKISTTPSITLRNVSESGKYLCEIVAKNPSLNTQSEVTTSEVYTIAIGKAQASIDTNGVTRNIYYNGKAQTVEGAILNHSEAELQYYNNTIKDVKTGQARVQIYCPETSNYKSVTEYVDVTIHKAKVTVKIDNKRSGVFSEKEDFTYSIKYGQVFEGDDLQIAYRADFSTFLAGTYTISAISLNSNYDVEILDGTYTVYIEGFSLVLIIVGITIFVALAVLITYFIIKKKGNDKFINAKDFDDDFEIRK